MAELTKDNERRIASLRLAIEYFQSIPYSTPTPAMILEAAQKFYDFIEG